MCLSTSNDIARSLYTYTYNYHNLHIVCFCDFRVANSVLEKVSPQLLSRNKEVMSTWISGVDGVLDKMGRDALVKLFE